jgi:hypothetical protein
MKNNLYFLIFILFVCNISVISAQTVVKEVVSSNDHVFVERFNNENTILTVFNESSEPQTVMLHFDDGLPQHWTNRLDGKKYETKTNTLILSIASEDIIVLKSCD